MELGLKMILKNLVLKRYGNGQRNVSE